MKLKKEKIITEEKVNELVELVSDVWNGRNSGSHGYIKLANEKYITVEPKEEDEIDYLDICLVDEIDFLGYPFSEYINFISVQDCDKMTKENLEKEIRDCFDYLISY